MNFRDKAREIRSRGEAERGNFAPTAGSVPVRMYQYWAKDSGKAPARENFCHFWRVVALWAPARFVKNKVMDVADYFLERKIATGIGLVVLYLLCAFVLLTTDALMGGILMFVIPLSILGTISGLILSLNLDNDPLTDSEFKSCLVFAFLGLPVSLPVFLLSKGIQNWPKSWTEPVGNAIAKLGIGILIAAGFALLTLGFLELGWVFLLYLVGILGGSAGVVFGGIFLVDFLIGRRAAALEREEKEAEEYFIVNGVWPTVEPKEPGRVKKFFSGVADFLILAAQVVRVKKWKICPMVTIPNDVQN